MLKRVIKEALPTMISFTMSGMYSVIDGIFVGNATGDVGLAAINLAWPIPALITAVGIGIGTGGSVLYSNYNGRGKTEECDHFYKITITLLMITAFVLTLALWKTDGLILDLLGAKGKVLEEAKKYTAIIIYGSVFQILGTGIIPLLRNMNHSVGAMITMTTGFLLNGLINYYLMFHKNMGIQGAAYGTVIAQFVVVIIGLLIIRKKEKKKYRFLLERNAVIQIWKIGISSFGASLAPTIALIFTNYQCLRYGGDKVVACYAVISYIVFPVQSFLAGIGDGLQPMISYYNGADKAEIVKEIRKNACLLNIVLGIFFAILSVLLTPYIGNKFGLSAEAKKYFGLGMVISASAFLFSGIAKFNISYSNAILRTKKAAFLTYVESLLISPLCLFLLPILFRINGIWISLPCTLMIMLGIYYTKLGGVTE